MHLLSRIYDPDFCAACPFNVTTTELGVRRRRKRIYGLPAVWLAKLRGIRTKREE